MGDAVLSAFLQVLFQSISDFVKKELDRKHLVEQEREQLIRNLDMIQAILRGAEKTTELFDESQALLFGSLKDASYYGVEILDDYNYEVQRRQVIHFPDIRNDHICSSVNPLRMKFEHDIEAKIMHFSRKIDSIRNLREMYSAFQGHRIQHLDGGAPRPSTLLPPTVIRGRHSDCNKIAGLLVQPGMIMKPNIEVLPIQGEAFIGKTSVAQLVLRMESVARHFQLKLWVHVSHEFRIERITSSIIESIEGFPFHCDNLNTLQMRVEKLLLGRRYLLVLDDYWSENWHDWERLKRSLVSGARGSKIIVTTRSDRVAQYLGTLATYKLQYLPGEDCWLLFCQCAQAGVIEDTRLKEVVLQKCKGIPFIAASLGYSINLHLENDRSKWADILLKEKWNSSPTDFNRARRLSYAQLDHHLKPCFAYCSIIPPKFQFEKEWLIQHWMAQGFVLPNSNTRETMEDMGRSYFNSLVSQSLIQEAHVDPTGQQHNYSLSETMHDLASCVSNADCKCYIMGESCNIPAKVWHLAVVFKELPRQDLSEIISCKELHSLTVLGGSEKIVLEIPRNIDEKFTRLRTLDLSNFGVTGLPKSIGKLKYLRCLQLQGTKIKFLPKSVCDLYHLQTLGLKNCYCLEELPDELNKLRKLRHIDLEMTRDPRLNVNLHCMPKGICLLTDLQILSRFVVSKSSSRRASIEELADLNHLHGKLFISNLHLVKNVQEAAQARLSSKQFLEELELSWGNDNNRKADKPGKHQKAPTVVELTDKKIIQKLDFPSSSKNYEQAEQILEHLKAPTTIKKLTLSGYTDTSCSGWLGSADYKNLVSVSLYDFERCNVLPPLGLLPNLQSLHLKGWDQLVSMNCGGFCGGSSFQGGGLHNSFRKLKKLHLERMDRLQHWEGDDKCAFPSLDELILENCCKLERVTHNLPSLIKLTVEGSPSFLGLRNFPSLKYLNVNASGEWIWESWSSLASPLCVTLCNLPTVHLSSGSRRFHTSLQRLEISNCKQLLSISDDWPPSNLIHFSVKNCPQLRKLPGGIQHLQALENMEIIDCGKLSCLPEMNGLKSLIRLEIAGCDSIRSLPYWGFPSSMQVLSIQKCPQLVMSCNQRVDKAKIEKIFSVWIDGSEISTSVQH